MVESKAIRKELTRQAQDTLEKAKKLRACQMQYCKKELEASQKLALQINEKTKPLLDQLAKKSIDMKTFHKKLEVIRNKLLDASETRILGACQVEKCEKELKESMRATLATFDTVCSVDNKSCTIYKKGMKLLEAKAFDQDKLIQLLKLLTTYRPKQ
jgi:soluble cytochrome b562